MLFGDSWSGIMVALFHHNVTKSPACLNQRGKSSENNKLLSSNRHQSRYVTQLRLFVQFSVEISLTGYCPNSPCWKSRKAAVHALICMHTHAAFHFINIFGVCCACKTITPGRQLSFPPSKQTCLSFIIYLLAHFSLSEE